MNTNPGMLAKSYSVPPGCQKQDFSPAGARADLPSNRRNRWQALSAVGETCKSGEFCLNRQ